MDLIATVLSWLGGKPSVDFGKVNPDSVDDYWRLDHDMDQAERKGPAQVSAALAKWGLRDVKHVERVKSEIFARLGNTPDFAMGAARVSYAVQMENMASAYQMPTAYTTPPHGMTLERYATLKARLQLGKPLSALLAEYQLDAGMWDAVQATWSERMGGQADAMAANMLSSMYSVLHQQALAAYGGR